MQKTTKIAGGTGSLKIDIRKLTQLRRGLKEKYVTQVGIIGKKAQGRKGELSNADIGLKHEKGSMSEKIPRRSFLEMPIFTHAQQLIADKKKIKNWVAQMISLGKNPKEIWKKAHKKLGISAEAVIQEAFESRGFGQWEPNSAKTIALKGSDSPLIDTAQMRKAVTSRVKS